ncbi:hypothetical protein M885DRAFT_623269 [Pelagophyceae sp. CCMP2097]|nr:hypothetical protein M885DRAFT_623269 [Pelagophyceae sp. CCMP2097]
MLGGLQGVVAAAVLAAAALALQPAAPHRAGHRRAPAAAPATFAPQPRAGAARSSARRALRLGAGADKGAPVPEAKELGLGELLEQYGLVAVIFHFGVFSVCCTAGFAALSLGDPAAIIEKLPDFVREKLQGEEGGDVAAGSIFALKCQVTYAVVELFGPARLALTVTATPAVAGIVRKVPALAALEEKSRDAILRLLPAKKDP